MYCPNCAASIDGSKYCRACGANVSLVPQALTGRLPETQSEGESEGRRGRHRRRGAPNLERAAGSFFTGIGFLFVSLAVWRFFPGGFVWWFWMLIPAFACIGEGVGQYLRVREIERQARMFPPTTPVQLNQPETIHPSLPPGQPRHDPAETSTPTTSELKPPSSITEHTTKHLEAQRRGE